MAVHRRKFRDGFALKSSSLLLAAMLCIVVTLYHYHAIGRFRLPAGMQRQKTAPLQRLFQQEGAEEDSTSDTVVAFQNYRPVWKRWKMHMFHQLDDDLVAEGNCVGWRQTGLCSPNGPVEPMHSLGCTAQITSASGYCLCLRGVRTHQVGCGAWMFTCMDACNEYAANAPHGLASSADDHYAHVAPTIASIRERGKALTRQLMVQRRLLADIHSQWPIDADHGGDAPQRSGNVPQGDFLTSEQRHDVEHEIRRRQKDDMWSRTKQAYTAWLRTYNDALRRAPSDEPAERVVASAEHRGAVGRAQHITSLCRAWRSVQGCDPQRGARQPNLDRGCGAVIPDGASGFCDCGPTLAVVVVGCNHRPFTCEHACRRDFDMGRLIAPKRYDGRNLDGDPQLQSVDTPPMAAHLSTRESAENRFRSSREFGIAHLAALHRALADVASKATHDGGGGGGGAANVIGESLSNILHVPKKVTPNNRTGSSSAVHRMPYRRPDVLEDPQKEQAYYKFLDGLVDEVASLSKKRQAQRNNEPLLMLPPSGAL